MSVSSTQRPKTALVVDDVKIYRELASHWLGELAVASETARSGNEAWIKFSRRPPDILVTDIDMTDGNGFELIARIRQADSVAERQTIIVVMSSLCDSDMHRFLGNVGADGFIAKPLDKQRLCGVITPLLTTGNTATSTSRLSLNDAHALENKNATVGHQTNALKNSSPLDFARFPRATSHTLRRIVKELPASSGFD